MIDSLIAYNTAELEKNKVLSEAKNLHKSKVISDEQWQNIQQVFATNLYTPTIFMKVLLFIFSLIGMLTIMSPIGLILSIDSESGYRFAAFILGVGLIIITERVLIKDKKHYKSGITEAGIYAGLLLIAFGILGFEDNNMPGILTVGFLFATFAAVRYLNLGALILSIFFFGWILFQITTDIGGIVQALMPFIFMTAFGLIYWGSKKLESKLSKVIFDSQFIIIKTISLLVFYLAGNYFVVRELSIELMGLSLADNEDIPYAFVFYILTALVPIGYLYWGIKHKSILFIRVALLTIALSVITLKIYFSLGMPVVTITVSGAILIVLALVFFKYLKQIRKGFTRDLLIHDKWNSQDLTAFVASQTLGGNKISDTTSDDTLFKGGQFGGGGAGGNW